MDPIGRSTELKDLRRMMSAPTPEKGSSFTALLELPPPKAMELLHSPENEKNQATLAGPSQFESVNAFNNSVFGFPANGALIESASKYSVLARNNSPETRSVSSKQRVKAEPAESESKSNPNSSQPLVSDPTAESQEPRAAKRKEREKKGKGLSKKSKNESSEKEKLPFVHVRARRGQATDSHSLAERARREKINARMKLLQELVPGCDKISGTAVVLDEIINHVQSLQRQVEFLSMRLAAVNPRIDFNLDSFLAAESGSFVDSNFPSMVMPPVWPEVQINGNRQQQYQQEWHFDALHQPVWGREEDNHNFVNPENSLLSYDASANSVSLHSNQVKMEL